MFYDLNLPVIDDPHLARARVATAIQLRWGAVATTQAATDTLTREHRCTIRKVRQEAVDIAARDAAPALQFSISLLRRPGGGKGRKKARTATPAAQRDVAVGASDAAAAPADVQPDGTASAAAVGEDPKAASAAAQPPSQPEAAEPAAAGGAAGADTQCADAADQPAVDVASSGPSADAAQPDAPALDPTPDSAAEPGQQPATCGAAPQKAPPGEPAGEAAEQSRQSFQQLTRLTFAAAEAGQAQLLASHKDIPATYDIVAVTPLSERVMQQACMALPVDLISLDLASRLPFRIKPQMAQAALARGVHFEVCYGPALRDVTSRRNVFANAQALARATRGRGIVLSSGAQSAFELRGPPDVANLATLFGLNQRQAKVALTDAPAAVVEHGVARRAYKGVLTIEQVQPAGGAVVVESGSAGGASGAVETSAAPAGVTDAAEGAAPVMAEAGPAGDGAADEASDILGALPTKWAPTPLPKEARAKNLAKTHSPPQPLRHKPQQQRQKQQQQQKKRGRKRKR